MGPIPLDLDDDLFLREDGGGEAATCLRAEARRKKPTEGRAVTASPEIDPMVKGNRASKGS